MASHGYLVFTVSHFDGTANFACKKNGEELLWTSNVPWKDIEYRRGQVKIRKEEVTHLLDDVSQPNCAQELCGFGPNVRIDLDNLMMTGHSFGGVTAIEVASIDSRVKYLLTLDPWVWVIH